VAHEDPTTPEPLARVSPSEAERIINQLLGMVKEQMSAQAEQLTEAATNMRTMFRLIVGITVFNTLLIGGFGGLNVLARVGPWAMSADHDLQVAEAVEADFEATAVAQDRVLDTGLRTDMADKPSKEGEFGLSPMLPAPLLNETPVDGDFLLLEPESSLPTSEIE